MEGSSYSQGFFPKSVQVQAIVGREEALWRCPLHSGQGPDMGYRILREAYSGPRVTQTLIHSLVYQA